MTAAVHTVSPQAVNAAAHPLLSLKTYSHLHSGIGGAATAVLTKYVSVGSVVEPLSTANTLTQIPCGVWIRESSRVFRCQTCRNQDRRCGSTWYSLDTQPHLVPTGVPPAHVQGSYCSPSLRQGVAASNGEISHPVQTQIDEHVPPQKLTERRTRHKRSNPSLASFTPCTVCATAFSGCYSGLTQVQNALRDYEEQLSVLEQQNQK